MNTAKFRTKTDYISRNNGEIKGTWEIGLDIGYSAVKLFSPNCVASFPSYCRKISKDFSFISSAPKESIIYRDLETGEMYLVGKVAQDQIPTGDTTDSEAALYGRDRYADPMFRVNARAGLGIAMMNTAKTMPMFDKKDKVVIQTGLPEKYMSDADDLTDALSGRHKFALKVGSRNWLEYDINIAPSDIYIMSQPRGTLFSVCIGKNGGFVEEAKKYLNSSVLVFDPGFGTLDIFPIRKGAVGEGETYSDLGMKRVLQETSTLIRDKYKVDISVPAMQTALETGTVRKFDKKLFQTSEYAFGELLEQAVFQVADEALSRMVNAINIADYNYLIVTGGTGAAWSEYIYQKLNSPYLTVVSGNKTDPSLDQIYSNVRGYYLYRYNKLAV